ncbi:hypothetical protein CDAR_287671 [Caerostris darwini]|uniref:Uncharacterized protein n=1 Tax=Caerostris darwini TaxID=1538125 RepID=A0AAV4ND38_9ARAC|nr:hypothetical protein CDAR_287671 [Caerostris darwini]
MYPAPRNINVSRARCTVGLDVRNTRRKGVRGVRIPPRSSERVGGIDVRSPAVVMRASRDSMHLWLLSRITGRLDSRGATETP